jgi:hypothetical protein
VREIVIEVEEKFNYKISTELVEIIIIKIGLVINYAIINRLVVRLGFLGKLMPSVYKVYAVKMENSKFKTVEVPTKTSSGVTLFIKKKIKKNADL